MLYMCREGHLMTEKQHDERRPCSRCKANDRRRQRRNVKKRSPEVKKLFAVLVLVLAAVASAQDPAQIEISCQDFCYDRCMCAGPGGQTLPEPNFTLCMINCEFQCTPLYI